MNNFILEHLRRIQADIVETRRNVRDLRASNAMILGMIAKMAKASARRGTLRGA